MDGTILGQGSFVVPASIVPRIIQVPSGVDWMRVVNYTRAGTVGGASAFGFEYYWQRGMANPASPFNTDVGQVKYYSNGSAIVNGDTLLSGGFTLFDPSQQSSGAQPRLSANIAITTGVSNATRPVVTTSNTSGLVAASSSNVGSVVRVFSPGFPSNGIDFTVGAVSAGVSFTLLSAAGALANAPGAAGTLGNYRIVNYDPLFYPRNRVIANISQAAQAVVSTTVPHQLTPGQRIRFNIPDVSGMVQLNATPANNYLSATVVSISATDANQFTIDVDTSTFSAFSWPTSAQQPSSYPELTPVGENTGFALQSPTIQVPGVSSATLGAQINATNVGVLADSTVNTGFLGMILGVGGLGDISGAAITGPAGSVEGDVVFWVAGKSTYGGL